MKSMRVDARVFNCLIVIHVIYSSVPYLFFRLLQFAIEGSFTMSLKFTVLLIFVVCFRRPFIRLICASMFTGLGIADL